MFGQFSRQHESDRSLDFPWSDGGFLVVAGKSRRFLGKLLENIVDETVHDAHGFAGDTNVRVNLLQNLEDVDFVCLYILLVPLLLLISTTPPSFGSFFPAFGFFSAGALSPTVDFFSSTGFFSAGFFSAAFGAIASADFGLWRKLGFRIGIAKA